MLKRFQKLKLIKKNNIILKSVSKRYSSTESGFGDDDDAELREVLSPEDPLYFYNELPSEGNFYSNAYMLKTIDESFRGQPGTYRTKYPEITRDDVDKLYTENFERLQQAKFTQEEFELLSPLFPVHKSLEDLNSMFELPKANPIIVNKDGTEELDFNVVIKEFCKTDTQKKKSLENVTRSI